MKKALKIFLAIVLVVLLVLVLLPSKVHVERSIEINSRAENIFEYVNVLRNWESWSPWEQKDSTIETTYSMQQEGIGSWAEWTNTKEEAGKQTILESVPSTYLKTKLEFVGMESHPSYSTWQFEETDGATKVTWSMDTDAGWNLIMRVFGLMFDKMMGPDFELGLSNLKNITEQIAEKADISVEQSEITESIWFISMLDSVSPRGMDTIHEYMYTTISKFMANNKLEQVSAPLAVYHKFDSEMIVLEAGIPVKDSVKTEGKIRMGKIYQGKVVSTTHFGNYENLGATHALLNEWISSNEIRIIGAPWEVYVTDPTTEKDMTKWQTKIYYPIE